MDTWGRMSMAQFPITRLAVVSHQQLTHPNQPVNKQPIETQDRKQPTYAKVLPRYLELLTSERGEDRKGRNENF